MTHQNIVDILTRNSQEYNRRGKWKILINGNQCNIGKPLYQNRGTARRKIINYVNPYGYKGNTETLVDDLIDQGIIKIEQI